MLAEWVEKAAVIPTASLIETSFKLATLVTFAVMYLEWFVKKLNQI